VLGSQIAFQTAYTGFEVVAYDINDESLQKARLRLAALVETYREVTGAADLQGRHNGQDYTDKRSGCSRCGCRSGYRSRAEVLAIKQALYEKLARLARIGHDLRHQQLDAAAQRSKGFHRPPEPLPRPALRPPDLEVQHRRSDGHCRHIGGRFRGGRGVSRCHRHGADPGTQGKSRLRTQSLLVPLLNAAADLAAGGYADPHDVDKVWRIATGAPLGPFQIYDVIGLNTPYNMLSHGDAQMRRSPPG
jgi:3-hydroxybutyryl-CoA dehydrogenase